MKKILGGIVSLLILTSIIGVVMAATRPTTATVTVNEFLSVTFTGYPVNFPSMDPDSGPIAAASGPLNVTVGSESNVDAIVKTRADTADFVYSTYDFPVSNMEWSDAASGTYEDYLITDATVCASVSAGSDCNIYHQLTIPGNTPAGAYSVNITITAIQVQ